MILPLLPLLPTCLAVLCHQPLRHHLVHNLRIFTGQKMSQVLPFFKTNFHHKTNNSIRTNYMPAIRNIIIRSMVVSPTSTMTNMRITHSQNIKTSTKESRIARIRSQNFRIAKSTSTMKDVFLKIPLNPKRSRYNHNMTKRKFPTPSRTTLMTNSTARKALTVHHRNQVKMMKDQARSRNSTNKRKRKAKEGLFTSIPFKHKLCRKKRKKPNCIMLTMLRHSTSHLRDMSA